MEKQNWNHDLMEHILSLMELLHRNGISAERASGTDMRGVLPEDPGLKTAYEMVRFMEEIPGGFMVYRADGDERIVYANMGLLRIFRCESWERFQELTGGSFRGVVHPEDLDEVEESIWRQIAGSQYDLDYVEYRIIRADGTIGWVEDYGHFVHSEAVGDFFYVFVGDATEKRDRRQSEQLALERRYQGLIEEYDRERALINQEYLRRLEVIEGLSVNYESILYAELERDRILPYRLSCRTMRQFGELYREKELSWYIADYISAWVHPEDRELVARETDPAYMREKLSKVSTYYLNYRVIYGEEVQYLQLRVVNVGGGERADQIVMGYRRVDEELQREMQQKQMLAEALENATLAIAAKNEFLSNMSHNMRTPLNAIFGFAALAREKISDPQTALGYLERLETSGRQLLSLIEEVLEITWLGSREEMTEEECDLCRIVQETCGYLRPRAEDKDLSFTLDCTGVTHSMVRGDKEKLGRLVSCLAGNAVTYTRPGGRVSVTLVEGASPRAKGRRTYRLIVADTGVGMSREFLERIFEPFARERNTTISGVYGMGLGLTIAKYIVDQMGGSIQVDSTEGEGSVFTVALQLQTEREAPAAAGTDAPEMVSGLRMLLVEDNEINREIETEILRNGGFIVDTAEDGSVAVEMVKNSGPEGYDLVLMDIQMPVMDGWQAARAIRELEDPDQAAIPIVALSANTLVGDMRRSMESGMDAHLTKPIDVARFMEEVHRAVRRHGISEKNS